MAAYLVRVQRVVEAIMRCSVSAIEYESTRDPHICPGTIPHAAVGLGATVVIFDFAIAVSGQKQVGQSNPSGDNQVIRYQHCRGFSVQIGARLVKITTCISRTSAAVKTVNWSSIDQNTIRGQVSPSGQQRRRAIRVAQDRATQSAGEREAVRARAAIWGPAIHDCLRSGVPLSAREVELLSYSRVVKFKVKNLRSAFMVLPTDIVEVGFQFVEINLKAHVEVAVPICTVCNERLKFAIPMAEVPGNGNRCCERER